MADPSRREVRNKLLALAHGAQWHGWERATIGALNSAGQQVVHAPGRPGWVYVSIERGDKLTATIALNSRVRPVYGMKVWVGTNADGLLAIMGIRETEVVEELGTQAAAATLPEVATKGLIPARRMQPGLVVALPQGTSYTMSVYVYPFIYVYQGDLRAWQGGWIDLTSHVPTSGAMRHWTLVCLDPETNTLSAIDGDDYGIPVTLTVDQLDDIDPGGAIPLAGVNLFYGMTAIDNENLFLDARPLLTGPGYNPISALRHNNTATVAPTATDDSADGYGRGSMWVDQTAGKIYICFDPTVGAAQWQEVGAGGAASASYDEFIDLIDTPDSYTGAGSKLVAVKATEDGLEFITAPVTGAQELDDLNDVDLTTTPPTGGKALTYDATSATWVPGDAGIPLMLWTIAGNQTPVASPERIYNTSSETRTILKVFIAVNTPPTGSALIVDVHKNGTTIFTNQANRPQIADGQYTGQSTSIDVTSWAPGDYLTVEVDQVGSTTPGADLTVQVALSDAAGGGGGGSGTDTTAIHTNTANEITGLTEKASPIAADLLVIEDSAAGNVKKKVQAGNLPFLSSLADHDHSGDAGDGGPFDAANLTSGAATDGHVLTADGLGGAAWEAPVGGEDPNAIHDNVDGEINAVTEKTTPVSADLVLIEDSAARYAKKKVQIGNLPGGGGSGITVYAEVVLFDVTLGADGNFDFQNIPQDYDHLKVYFFGQRSSTAGSGGVYLNNDTTETNYRTSLHQSGSNHTNALNNNAGLLNTPSISYFDGNIWCKATIEIPNYRATSYKVLYARMVQFDLDAGPVFAWHSYYINSMVHKGGTAAINRLTITQGATGWLDGSRCVVVGVGPLQLLAAT